MTNTMETGHEFGTHTVLYKYEGKSTIFTHIVYNI
jgi:hypothetical protein